MSILNQAIALAAASLLSIHPEERETRARAALDGDRPSDAELERRDRAAAERKRGIAARVAADRGIADKYQAERLSHKQAAWEKRQPYAKGYVVIGGMSYPAQQKPPDGNFRKRATRFLKDGQWSAWCKDDHDLFVDYMKDLS